METAYTTVLTLTQDNLVKAVRCPIIVDGEKVDFRIPAQNDPFLIFQHDEFVNTDLGRFHCNEWFDSIGLGTFEIMLHFIKCLTPVEFLMKDSSGVSSIAGNLKHDPSLFRRADEECIIYSNLYDEVPEPSDYQVQVRNSTSEWSTELDVWSGVNLKFRIINLENPTQIISQDFDFQTVPIPFNGRLDEVQSDGFQVFFNDSSLPYLTVSAYNKDTGFTGTVLLRYIE